MAKKNKNASRGKKSKPAPQPKPGNLAQLIPGPQWSHAVCAGPGCLCNLGGCLNVLGVIDGRLRHFCDIPCREAAYEAALAQGLPVGVGY